jgi:hypothetical protein
MPKIGMRQKMALGSKQQLSISPKLHIKKKDENELKKYVDELLIKLLAKSQKL